MPLFRDRQAAGQRLAEALVEHASSDPVVVAIPRGGVPVGYEVARALDAPLDVLVIRKLGVPGHEELFMGAVAARGARVLNQELIFQRRIPSDEVQTAIRQETAEVDERGRRYREGAMPVELVGRNVVLVDDGLVTGLSAKVALREVGVLEPAHVTLAVPVAPRQALEKIASECDQVVCLATEEGPFDGWHRWYEQFPAMDDAQVESLMRSARQMREMKTAPPMTRPA